jgi:hypothetical protein
MLLGVGMADLSLVVHPDLHEFVGPGQVAALGVLAAEVPTDSSGSFRFMRQSAHL